MQILSVAENDGKSESIAARQIAYSSHAGVQLHVEIGFDRSFLVSKKPMGIPGCKVDTIQFSNLDIDGMIEFLLEAKRLISEEDMYKKLVGRK
jgi:hypothetical protein